VQMYGHSLSTVHNSTHLRIYAVQSSFAVHFASVKHSESGTNKPSCFGHLGTVSKADHTTVGIRCNDHATPSIRESWD
jgi:hypothetical protein